MARFRFPVRSRGEAWSVYRLHAGSWAGANYPYVRLGHNTTLWFYDHAYRVRYHDTDVVQFHEDGSITLDPGGWHTKTTAERLRVFTPDGVRVSARSNGGDYRTEVYVDGAPLAPFATLWGDDTLTLSAQTLAGIRTN